MKCLIIAAFLLFFSSCNQKNPNPERLDEVYLDLVTELDIASKSLEAEEKNLANLIKERDLAIPQTGQIKFANKKISDSEAKLNRLKQQKLYFEIKIEQRVRADKINYENSLKEGGKPYPDKDEISLYKSVVKFQREKLMWDKNKGIKKDVPRGTDKKTEAPEKAKE
ncbi:MAG: hypothetical protein ABL930_03145 [Pseudobdellovibrio sp.]